MNDTLPSPAHLASNQTPLNADARDLNVLLPLSTGENNFYGPPYALLQGSMATMPEQPPFEVRPTAGSVYLFVSASEGKLRM